MPETKQNHYTVCILFDADLANCLLVRKTRTAFKNMLNGVGGAVEPGETSYECALREIREETNIRQDELRSLGCAHLAWLGTLDIPVDCKMNDGSGCVLHYYAGVVKPEAAQHIRADKEPITWMPAATVMNHRPDSRIFAGSGDLAYFATAGYAAMCRYIPGLSEKKPEPASSVDAGLDAAIAAARGRLDRDLRRGDMFQASVDASDIAKLAYAKFYASDKNCKPEGGIHEPNDRSPHTLDPKDIV